MSSKRKIDMVMLKPTKEQNDLWEAAEKETDPKKKEELMNQWRNAYRNDPRRKVMRDAGISC